MPNFNIHWKIPFMSLRAGTLYTVNIYKDGALPSGYPLTLKGAAQPFVTQEDDDEDQFIAIRTQTGYLRIVDDGKAIDSSTPPQTVNFNWKELLPDTDTDRPVTLTHVESGQTVVDWQGYLQAQTFTGTLYGGVQEREFPVQCMLSALSASNVDDSNRELKNFAYVIKQAFDNLPCITIKNYIFQGGQYAQQWLLKLVDWQNLVSITENGVTGAYDNQRIIQDLCSFWGWTCRVYGQNVIFSCTDDTELDKALVLTGGTGGSLETMAGGTSAGTTNTDFLTAISLTGNIFASDSNDDTRVRGYNKAVVNVDVNEIDTDIATCFPSSVEEQMADGSWNFDGIKTYYTDNLYTFSTALLSGGCRLNYGSFNIARVVNQQDVSDYSVYDVIRIYKSAPSQASIPSTEAYVTVMTKFHHTYPGGSRSKVIGLQLHGTAYIKGDRYEDYDSIKGAGKKTMFMRIGIGTNYNNAKWWTGLTWSSSKSSFRATLGNQNDIIFSHYATGHGSGNSTPYIPLPSQPDDDALHGLVFIEFLGSDDMPENSGERIFDITDFRVEYYGDTTYDIRGEHSKNSDAEYVSNNQQKISSEWDADLIYASQNRLAMGYGLVINNSDFAFMEKAQYPSATDHPEQRLATRVANYWASAKRKLSTELRANVIPSITPQHKVTLDQTPSYPIAISRDWWNDIIQLTLLEA